MNFKSIASFGVVVACLVGPVSATTITIGDAPDTAALMPLATSTTGVVFENVTDSVTNVRLSAWHLCDCGVVANDSDAWYTSVSGVASATYSFGTSVDSVSFLWGSPDIWNDLDFNLIGGGVVTVNGLEAQGTVGIAAQYVTISDVGLFDSVTFRSSVNAFEFASLSSQISTVPVPASMSLLLAGAGVLAWNSKRRKRK